MSERYVLITPAYNEERYIEETICAVAAQELPPLRWVIVSDGSTDRTDAIVAAYARRHGFITLLRRERTAARNFSSKVEAIRAGFALLAVLPLGDPPFDYYGNLDADVSFAHDYYRKVIGWMEANPRLGIAGGRVYDVLDAGGAAAPEEATADGLLIVANGRRFRRQAADPDSVAGPIQLFRRACYEQIGGYPAVPGGLVDAIAEVTARMHGWETRTREDLLVLHHRSTGSEGRSLWACAVEEGVKDYSFGCHPLWHTARAIQRALRRPVLLGSLLRAYGYWSRALRRSPRPVSREFVRFLRREEARKARRLFAHLRRLSSGRPAAGHPEP